MWIFSLPKWLDRGLQIMTQETSLPSTHFYKVLREHSHVHSFMYHHWLLSDYKGEISGYDTLWPEKLKIFTM